ncbi:MAG TPA: hypothetical protein VK589_16025 [Chryseolinea sp.]|nr:hypothetical protein [Chryseolinea sp.]
MKITKFLLLSLAVIFLSCSEDEDPKPTSEGMVGNWAITALDYKGTTTTTAQGASIKADFTGTGKDMDLITTFNSTPNTVTSEGSYTIVLKTTYMGQSTTDEYEMDETVTDGTWTLSGNTLTVTNDFGPQTATILEQTSTTLKLKAEVSESESDQGITVSTKIEAIYTFTKQ